MSEGTRAGQSAVDITITRVFDAPRDAVFRAWTEPEQFSDWFGGPEADIPLSTVSMDVRPGGSWRATMFFGEDRREIPWSGEYHEVVPPERLVFTLSDDPGAEPAIVTVVLNDLGDGRTEMLFHQSDKLPPEERERAKAGWGVFFDRMAERLASA